MSPLLMILLILAAIPASEGIEKEECYPDFLSCYYAVILRTDLVRARCVGECSVGLVHLRRAKQLHPDTAACQQISPGCFKCRCNNQQ